MQRRSRQVVERCFALLKTKLRRLKAIDVKNLDYLSDIIIACCCLHNFVLDLPFFEHVNMAEFLRDHPVDDEEDIDEDNAGLDRDIRNQAQIRRDDVAGFFVSV